MSDHLYIDTTKARTAARHLRHLSSRGGDHAADIARAYALADLVDTVGARLVGAVDALTDLATVLEERSDTVDSGGLLPYRTSAATLAAITESLYRYTPPSADSLFPVIGPATTGVRPPTPIDLLVDDPPHHRDRLVDPIISWFRPVIDAPIVSPLDVWDDGSDRVTTMLDTVDSFGSVVGDAIDDRLPPIDWSAAERFADRVQAAATDPLALSLGPHAVPIEVASYYGWTSVAVMGLGVHYSRAGDDRRRLGFSVPVGPPPVPSLLPTITFTPSNRAPESGFNANGIVCNMVCIGTSVDEDLNVFPSVGLGPPSATVDGTYTHWIELGPGDDD